MARPYRFLIANFNILLGVFCGTWFHFFAHDMDGPIGTFLRNATAPVQEAVFPFLDDRTFAFVMVGIFMQVMGMLQTPALLGPSFSPFNAIGSLFNSSGNNKQIAKPMSASNKKVAKTNKQPPASMQGEAGAKKKKNRTNKNKQKAA